MHNCKIMIAQSKDLSNIVRNLIRVFFCGNIITTISVKTINNSIMVTLCKPQRVKSFFGYT